MMPRSEAGNWIERDGGGCAHPEQLSRSFFTFIELSVVIVIIGVFALLVGPRMTGRMRGGGLDSAVKRVAVLGEHAASLASTSGQVHILRIELSEGFFYISPWDGDEKESLAPHAGNIYSLPDGVRFTGARLEQEEKYEVLQVRFAPDGWADNAVIVLEEDGGRRMAVSFTLSMGKVQVSEGDEIPDY